MRNIPSVIVITGPAGSGKSSTARLLASELKTCYVIDIETINYMLVDGFKTRIEDGGEVADFTKWELAADAIGVLTKHFTDNAYHVIIHGHVTKPFISRLERNTVITHKLLLLPEIDVVITRDHDRGSHLTMGEAMVRQHYQYFIDNNFDGFVTIDSTNRSLSQTVFDIRDLLVLQVAMPNLECKTLL